MFILHFFSQDILKIVHFFHLFLYILFYFSYRNEGRKCAFLPHNCIFTLLIFAFRRSKNCPRSHFFCSPHHFSRFSSLEKLPPAPSRQYITDYNRDREIDMKLKYGLVTSAIEANAEDCCYISIDDIGVRFQKAKRNCSYNKKQKFIENTVIHIQKGESQYTITALGMKNAFVLLVAFLIDNNLTKECRLVFLTDGAKCISDNIECFHKLPFL